MNPNQNSIPNQGVTPAQPGQPTGQAQENKAGAKKKKKNKLSLEGENRKYAMIFMAILLGIIGYFYYGGVSQEVETLNNSIASIEAEEASITAYKNVEKQEEITTSFPLYSDPGKDFLEKEDADTAIEIRDLAQKNQLAITGYETGISDASMAEWTESSTATTGAAQEFPTLIIPSKRKAGFIVAGQYDSMISFLLELEKMKRFTVISDLSFSGSISAEEEGESQSDFFSLFDNVSSVRIEVSYYYLNSSLPDTTNSINNTTESDSNSDQTDDTTDTTTE